MSSLSGVYYQDGWSETHNILWLRDEGGSISCVPCVYCLTIHVMEISSDGQEINQLRTLAPVPTSFGRLLCLYISSVTRSFPWVVLWLIHVGAMVGVPWSQLGLLKDTIERTQISAACTVKAVLKDRCHERPPVLKDQIFLAESHTFQCKWTCHQRPPVLRDHIFVANRGSLTR